MSARRVLEVSAAPCVSLASRFCFRPLRLLLELVLHVNIFTDYPSTVAEGVAIQRIRQPAVRVALIGVPATMVLERTSRDAPPC